MPHQPNSTREVSETVPRTLRCRLYPGDAVTGLRLTAIAGACRYVWNHMPADCEWRYARGQEVHVPAAHWREVREGRTAWVQACKKRMGPRPATTFFTLGPRFTALRKDPDHAWLKAYPYQVVRDSLKYLADAYTRYKAYPANAGKPRFKARHFSVSALTIPSDVKIRDGRLRVPKVGWLRLAGSDPYAGCQPLTVRVRMEGTEQHPKWYAYICYEVTAKQPAADGALGLPHVAVQATDRLDARIARQPRELSRKQGWGPQSHRGRRVNGQLRKLHRTRRRQRDDATHQASRKLADAVHTVVVEDLHTKAMTQSAQGTVAKPGKQVKQKAGALLKVDPASTSQTCRRCGHGHRDHRPAPAVFACGACGFQAHADPNAAVNMLARAGLPSRARAARGTGAAARRGAIPSGTPTSWFTGHWGPSP